MTHRWLGFEQASLTIDPPMIGHADGTLFARLLVTGPVIAGEHLTRVDGRWLISDGLVITTIASHNLYLREHFIGCVSEDHARPGDEFLRRNSSCSSASRKLSAKLFAPSALDAATPPWITGSANNNPTTPPNRHYDHWTTLIRRSRSGNPGVRGEKDHYPPHGASADSRSGVRLDAARFPY